MLGKVVLGVDISECVVPAELRRVAKSVSHLLEADIMEVYRPERVAKLCEKHGLTPCSSLYVAGGFNFDRAEERRKALEIMRRDKPFTLINHQPCIVFSIT